MFCSLVTLAWQQQLWSGPAGGSSSRELQYHYPVFLMVNQQTGRWQLLLHVSVMASGRLQGWGAPMRLSLCLAQRGPRTEAFSGQPPSPVCKGLGEQEHWGRKAPCALASLPSGRIPLLQLSLLPTSPESLT